MKEKLRIAVLIESEIVSNWIYQMLSKINSNYCSEIVLLIKSNQCGIKKRKSKFFIYNLYRKLDRKQFRVFPDALEDKSLNSLLNIDIVSQENIEAIKRSSIDILILLSPVLLSKEVVSLVKYGAWSFYVGDIKKNRGAQNLFWDVIDRKGRVNTTLKIQTNDCYKMTTLTTSLTDNLSVNRSANSYYWKAAAIMPRKINELYRVGEITFFNKLKDIKEDLFLNLFNIEHTPTNWQAIIKLLKFNLIRMQNGINGRLYFNQWILLFRLENSKNTLKDLTKFKEIVPPKDRFWADPHVLMKNGKYYIFIEELIYKENKGFISVIEMDENGNYKDPVKVLESDCHMSFPFVFEENDQIYMIPETKEANSIQLYKCIDFPYKWEFKKVLIDNVKAVDTVLFKNEGKYWLFTNMVENEGASFYDELYLFSSKSLISDNWKSHPDNPIVSDVRNARMAGKLFFYNKSLYRPAQNCSNHYGYGMQLNRVETLNESNYSEELFYSIIPDWNQNIIATHSISTSKNLTIIDAQYRRRK